jgi:hypothetical protein
VARQAAPLTNKEYRHGKTTNSDLSLAVLATFSGFATAATIVKSSESYSSDRVAIDKASLKLLKGKVTEVNNQAKIFTVAVVFSAAKLSMLPTVGEIIDISYVETPGGLAATTVKSSKSNSSDRVATGKASAKLLKGKVTEVNNQAKTFTVAVVFSAAKLSMLPTVGEIIDITYIETPGGGPMEASNLDFSKSNVN